MLPLVIDKDAAIEITLHLMHPTHAPLLSGNTTPDPKKKPLIEFGALWPLLLHFVTSIGIAFTVVYCVDSHDFDTGGQPLSTSFADAIKMRYRPSQSDVTTLISGSITVLRTIAMAWSGPLYWRSAFLLLEKTGLRHPDLKWHLNYGLFRHWGSLTRQLLFHIAIISLGTIPAQLADPILTGSISWIPSTRTAGLVAETALNVSTISSTYYWDSYSGYTPRRRYTTLKAAGHVATAWGRDFEAGVLKRVVPSTVGIPVGSIVANMTLPYFSVTSLEWITNPTETLTANQLDIYKSVAANLSTFGSDNPLLSGTGALALIQDSPWSARSFPAPSIVSETCLLALYTDWRDISYECGQDNSLISNNLPPAMGFHQTNGACFAFAQVTYSAGVGVCANRRVSAPLTVQNSSAISLREDSMTTEALRMMPDITSSLVLINTSIPTTWGNIDDYVIDVLGRSYSGAWTALTEYMGTSSPPLTSSFTPSVLSSQVHVALWRVYLWLSVQFLATVSGILFIWIQSGAENRLVGNTTLAAFYLDTTAVPRRRSSEEGLLMFQGGDEESRGSGRLKVILKKVSN